MRSSVDNHTVLNWNSPSVEVLFQLLRIALGKEEPSSLPNDVNWEELFALSIKQDVVNIAYDGLQKIIDSKSEKAVGFDTPKLEELRYKWIGYGMLAEKKYESYSRIVSDLAHLYSEYGYQMLLLKGYGLSLYYPIPSHRSTGDIDVSVMRQGEELESAQIEADKIFQKKLGMQVTKSKIGHHSHFTYHGILVENHYEYSNTYFGSIKVKKFEDLLQSLAKTDRQERNLYGQTIYLPSPTFNALFLMWHMATHFCNSRIALRQLCDWGQFLSAEHQNIDWLLVKKVIMERGLEQFANTVNYIIKRYLGYNLDCVDSIEESKIAERVIDDVFSTEEYCSFLSRINRFPSFGWKYKLVHNSNCFFVLFRSFILHLFHGGDIVEKEI